MAAQLSQTLAVKLQITRESQAAQSVLWDLTCANAFLGVLISYAAVRWQWIWESGRQHELMRPWIASVQRRRPDARRELPTNSDFAPDAARMNVVAESVNHGAAGLHSSRVRSELVFNNLQEGFNVFRVFNGREGIEQAVKKQPDIIVLNLMLPRIGGMDIFRHLRKQKETKKCEILMLTAKGEYLDQIDGFSAGADDYVVKPYSVRVLLERIRALQRHQDADHEKEELREQIECTGIRIDLRRYEVTVDDNTLELTRSEFKLLKTLVAEPGRAFDRSELIESALGEDTLVLERTIDVHIRAIRRKFGDLADLVETVRGVGYRFKEPQHPPNDSSVA